VNPHERPAASVESQGVRAHPAACGPGVRAGSRTAPCPSGAVSVCEPLGPTLEPLTGAPESHCNRTHFETFRPVVDGGY